MEPEQLKVTGKDRTLIELKEERMRFALDLESKENWTMALPWKDTTEFILQAPEFRIFSDDEPMPVAKETAEALAPKDSGLVMPETKADPAPLDIDRKEKGHSLRLS